MTHYMTLVPATSVEGHFTLPSGDLMNFDDTRFHQVLFGGDQLTVARMRGTQALCDTQDKPADQDDTYESKTDKVNLSSFATSPSTPPLIVIP